MAMRTELLSTVTIPTATAEAAAGATDPIACTIPDAIRLTGLPRTKLYELAGRGDVVFLKAGRRTLVSVRSLRDYVAGLPAATVRAPRQKAA